MSQQERRADLAGTRIIVRFPYSPLDVDRARLLDERRWEAPRKCWTAALTKRNVDKLTEWGFTVSPELLHWKESGATPSTSLSAVKDLILTELGMGSMDDPTLKELFPYQRAGVLFAEAVKGRLLIADEMGLGKTVQALRYLVRDPANRLPAVVLCPASVKGVWMHEAVSWGMGKIHPVCVEGRKPYIAQGGNLFILNYDIIPHHWRYFSQGGIRTLVMDECHYLKNPSTKRTQAVRPLARTATNVIGLSGTPITNRPSEYHVTLSLINPLLFPSRHEFLKRYCGLRHNGFGWVANGATNIPELRERLAGTVLRRRKMDVLKDLPAKMHNVVPLEMRGKAATDYALAEGEFLEWAERTDPSDNIAENRLEALKQLSLAAKWEAAMEWIHNVLDTGEKLILFCHHKSAVAKLRAETWPCKITVIDGSTPPAQRPRNADAFQMDPEVRLFIGTLAAKEGLTLTAASRVAFLELWWVPGHHDQAEDRPHRIGQTAECVMIYYLIAVGSVEEKIAAVLDEKRKVLSKVLDGKEANSESMIASLMRKLKRRNQNGSTP